MRVALLRIRMQRDSRAAGIQCVLAAVDRAARATPAPDLLVLPARCDANGLPADADAPESMFRGVREALAQRARDWGVFIAAGLHTKTPERYQPCTVLFDANGDAVAGARAEPSSAGVSGEIAQDAWRTAVGVVAVHPPVATTGDAPPEHWRGALLAWPWGGSCKAAAQRDRLPVDAARLAQSSGAHVAVVSAAGIAPAITGVHAPDGRVLGQCETDEESVIHVDVDIPVPAPAAASDSCGGDDHAG